MSDLMGWGVIPNKSRVECPTHAQLVRNGSFWRGVIDGDGTITFDPFGAPILILYSSSRLLLEQYCAYVNHVVERIPKMHPCRRISRVTVTGTPARRALEDMAAATGADMPLARKETRVAVALEWRSEQERTHARNLRVAAGYRNGERVGDLARREGLDRQTVRQIATRYGAQQRPGRGSSLAVRRPDLHAAALQAYVTDEPLDAIAARLRCSSITVRRIAISAGIPLRGPGGWRGRRAAQLHAHEVLATAAPGAVSCAASSSSAPARTSPTCSASSYD
ncbi:MAG: hypothetical protein ACXVXL_31205 [Solirubrobacteraceae bacterium]